jgi:hypothetical protein
MSPRDVIGKYTVKIVVKHAQSGITIGGDIFFFHKSNQQTKSLTACIKMTEHFLFFQFYISRKMSSRAPG